MSSSEAYFLGIDVGTTAVKGSVIGVDAVVHAEASVPYPTSYLRPSWVEQDPEDWWRATVEVINRLGRDRSGLLAGVVGVAVSAQAPTMIALDASGAPLRPALIWMDRRADAESAALGAEFGAERYLTLSGNRHDPFYVGPKLRWLVAHEPATVDKTAAFVQINGYIAYRLTGQLSLDAQHASLLGLRDISANTWSPELLHAVGVVSEQFPAVVTATTVIGEVTAAAAEQTGLAASTPVAAGTVDSAAASLESGVVTLGQAAEMTGTSTVVTFPRTSPLPTTELITMASAVPGQWLHLAAMVATGASLQWLRDTMAPDQELTGLTAQAEAVAPGAGGIFLPYMMGERSPLWSTDARGMFLGLSLSTGLPELTRAVLEGTAFALRHNLEAAAAVGSRPQALRAIGGPAANDLWCQIKADVTGVPVLRMRGSTGATFGGAMIAAAATGHVDNLVAAVSAAAQEDRQFSPNPAHADVYDELFAIYRSSYDHVRTDLAALAQIPSRKGA